MGSNKKLTKGISIRGANYIYEIINTIADSQFVASVKMSGELGSIDSLVRVLIRQYDSMEPAERLKAEALKESHDFIESIDYEESVLIVQKISSNDSYVDPSTHDDDSNDERTEYQEAEDDGFVHFDNNKYMGELKDGSPHGKGKMLWNDHSVYNGEWVNGYMHGNGTMTWPSGKQYTGEWKKNEITGYGEMTYPDKRFYRGTFVAGLRHGQGILIWPNGKTFKGEFSRDKMTKNGEFEYDSNYLDNQKRQKKEKRKEYIETALLFVFLFAFLAFLFSIAK